MTDEAKAAVVEEGVEGKAPPEVVEPTKLSDIEQKAYDKGWRQEAEWKGDPDEFVEAKEFVGRQPLYDGLSTQGKTIKQLKRTVQQLAEHNRKVEATALERAQAQLSAKKVAAYEDSKYEEVVAIEKEQRQLEEQEKSVQSSKVSAVFAEWREENEWYGTDENLTAWADGYGKMLADSSPDMEMDKLYSAVAEQAKKVFPNKFGGNGAMPPNVPGSNKQGRTSGGAGFDKLSAEEKRLCNELVESGVLTKDEYVKQIHELNSVGA